MTGARKAVAAAAIAAMTAAFALGAVPSVLADEARVHTVVRGDTLWDISSTYLYDPFLWPQVWNVNREIENPHLIYPGQSITIPARTVQAAAPKPAEAPRPELPPPAVESAEPAPPEPVPAEPPPEPVTAAQKEQRREMILALSSYGFILESDEVGLATITGMEEDHLLISPGHKVYLTPAREDALSQGVRYSIVRVLKEVRHPVTGDRVGYLANALGDLTVTEAGPKRSSAIIGEVYRPAEKGDRVIEHIDYMRSLPREGQVAGADIKGYVLVNPDSKTIMGAGDVLFIDRGAAHGLRTGDTLDVWSRGSQFTTSATQAVDVPPEAIGKIQVIVPRDQTSVARVIRSSREIRPGDKAVGSAQ